jgi:hypothetical protein
MGSFSSFYSFRLTPLLRQAWDLLERESLFCVYDHESEERNDAHHLATMTAILGPPPPEFLNRSKETSKYWDEDGKYHRQQALILSCPPVLTNLL